MFGKGLSTDDEPDIWQKDLTGAIETWIDVGQPDERRIRKACGRARDVNIYAYGEHGVGVWWSQVQSGLERCRNLTVKRVPTAAVQALGLLAGRNMALHCTVQDGHVWLSDSDSTVDTTTETLHTPDPPRR
jgi:uncharacterized protein YaeQ